MSRIFQQLDKDHRHFSWMIKLFEKELTLFIEGGDQRAESLMTMLETLEYIQTYPELWHHPIEERVFRVLESKMLTPAERDLFDFVSEQHGSLQKLTADLRCLLESIINGQMVPIHEVSTLSARFISEQLHHIEVENNRVFPVIQRFMTDEDWCKVQSAQLVVDNVGDGDNVKELLKMEYDELYSYLRSQASA